MSSMKLDRLISEFPAERDAIVRLGDFIGAAQRAARVRIYPIERFSEVAEPSSERNLLGIVSRLVQDGTLRKVVRVESASGGGIGDFETLADVPDQIFDSRQGIDVEVLPENIRLLFEIKSSN